jgi:peptidoglycan-associated lipoprotein
MKRSNRFLLPAVFLTFGLLTDAVSQQPAQTNDQASSAILAPQTQPWIEPNAVEGLKDVLFDLDVSEFVSEPAVLQADAQWLKEHPDVQVKLDGNADPRGDIVYNLVLSHQRANTVRHKLVEMGIAEDRIVFATGWGKLYRNCLDGTEACWRLNRRVQFVHANPAATPASGQRSR